MVNLPLSWKKEFKIDNLNIHIPGELNINIKQNLEKFILTFSQDSQINCTKVIIES